MKVRAKTNIKYGGGWYAPGEEIEIREEDLPTMKGMVITFPEARAEKKPEETSPDAEAPQEPERKPARKPRKRAE